MKNKLIFSKIFPSRHWYPVAKKTEVTNKKPKKSQLFGVPLVLWRTKENTVACLVDRCAHRGVPLSAGKIDNNNCIRCPYHGWSYNSKGICQSVPAQSEKTGKYAQISAFDVQEVDGLIWVRPKQALQKDYCEETPPNLSFLKNNDFSLLFYSRDFDATLTDTIENFVDSPHSTFVHKGIIRGKSALKMRTVDVKRSCNSVIIQHQPVLEKVGPLNFLLNPQNNLVEHSDTVKLPGRIDIRYHLGNNRELHAYLYCVSRSTYQTSVYLFLGFNFGYLTKLAKFILPIFARIVLTQDIKILKTLTENKRLFGNNNDIFLTSDLGLKHVRHLLNDWYLGQNSDENINESFQIFA